VVLALLLRDSDKVIVEAAWQRWLAAEARNDVPRQVHRPALDVHQRVHDCLPAGQRTAGLQAAHPLRVHKLELRRPTHAAHASAPS